MAQLQWLSMIGGPQFTRYLYSLFQASFWKFLCHRQYQEDEAQRLGQKSAKRKPRTLPATFAPQARGIQCCTGINNALHVACFCAALTVPYCTHTADTTFASSPHGNLWDSPATVKAKKQKMSTEAWAWPGAVQFEKEQTNITVIDSNI